MGIHGAVKRSESPPGSADADAVTLCRSRPMRSGWPRTRSCSGTLMSCKAMRVSTRQCGCSRCDAVQVAPRAQWLARERELQWDFAELHSGSKLMLRVLLPAGTDAQSAQDARVRTRLTQR